MTLIIDYYDPEFDLRPAAQSSLNVLVPAFSPNARGAIAVVEHAVHYAAGGCPMSTMTPPPARPVPYLPFAHPGCADEMGGALGAAFVPVLGERMLYMLSRFPAPLLWNANGQSSKPLVFAPVDKYQAEQIILYYGRLAPQP